MARKSNNNSNFYFTEETEEYIKKYNLSQDYQYRDKIFTQHIYFPFYKLAENIIHTFKFHYTDVEDIEDLKHEIVAMIVEEKISRFDPDNGAKAYSYFGTIIKRWLINYTNKNYKKLKQVGSFDDIEETYENPEEEVWNEHITLKTVLDIWVEKVYRDLEDMFVKEEERKVADGILTLFKSRYDLDIFKKKALYIYVREIVDCKTPTITKVISILKKDFYKLYNIYLEQGRVSIP